MKNVVIYSSKTCPHCVEAKKFFDENSVAYTDFDVSSDKEARKELMKKGYMSVPVIVIDGEEILGFEKDKISSLLGI